MRSLLRLSYCLLCWFLLFGAQSVQAQKTYHKPVHPAPTLPITVEQIIKLYNCQGVASADEYLTAHNWRFSKSQAGDDIDQATYIHSGPGGSDAILSLYLCNTASNGFCTKSEIHEGTTMQHIYLIYIKTSKTNFEALKRKVNSIEPATATRLHDNKITTIYEGDEKQFEFEVDNSGDYTTYYTTFRDRLPVAASTTD